MQMARARTTIATGTAIAAADTLFELGWEVPTTDEVGDVESAPAASGAEQTA